MTPPQPNNQNQFPDVVQPPSVVSLDILKSIRIASPCSVSWESMSGDERSRMCRMCNRTVYDISKLTSLEAAALLCSEVGGKIPCVKLYRRADGTILTKDCPVGLRIKERAFGVWRAIASVFAMFILVNPSARAADAQRVKPVAAGELKILVTPVVSPSPPAVDNRPTVGIPISGIGPWMRALDDRIFSFSGRDRAKSPVGAVIAFKVYSNGEISDLRVQDSSGHPAADALALSIIRAAAPFRKLPEDAGSVVDIEYTFQKRAVEPATKSDDGSDFNKHKQTALDLAQELDTKRDRTLFKGRVEYADEDSASNRFVEEP